MWKIKTLSKINLHFKPCFPSFKLLGNNNAQMICFQETEIASLVLFLTKLSTYLKGKTPSPAMPLYLPALLKWLSWVTGLKIGSNRKQTHKKHQLLETYSQSWGKVSWGAALTVFVQTEAFLSPWNPSSCPQHRDDGRQSDLGRSSMAPGGCGAAEQGQALSPSPPSAFSQSLSFLP